MNTKAEFLFFSKKQIFWKKAWIYSFNFTFEVDINMSAIKILISPHLETDFSNLF